MIASVISRRPSDACSALKMRRVASLSCIYISIMCYCKSAISRCAGIFVESSLKELGRSGLFPSLFLHSQFSDVKVNDEPSRASVGEMRAVAASVGFNWSCHLIPGASGFVGCTVILACPLEKLPSIQSTTFFVAQAFESHCGLINSFTFFALIQHSWFISRLLSHVAPWLLARI